MIYSSRGLSPVNEIFPTHAQITFIKSPMYYNIEVTDDEISIPNTLKFTDVPYSE